MTQSAPHHLRSAGCVVYKISSDQTLYLIGKHSSYHKWVLPKGIIESGETALQAAIREVQEETGITATPTMPEVLYEDTYWFYSVPDSLRSANPHEPNPKTYAEQTQFKTIPTHKRIRIHKTVTWFLAKYHSGSTDEHNWEMSVVKWVPFAEALELLAFNGEHTALQKAQSALQTLAK